MERASVLDRYFDDIMVEPVESDEKGWDKIKEKPAMWRWITPNSRRSRTITTIRARTITTIVHIMPAGYATQKNIKPIQKSCHSLICMPDVP